MLIPEKSKTKLNTSLNKDVDLFFSDLIRDQLIFEDNFEKNKRRTSGVYLTNELEVIDKILSCIPITEDVFNKNILEPACGQGIFLLRLLSKIYLRFPSRIKLEKFIENNLYFVDIDNEMLDLTKSNIRNLYRFLFENEYLGEFNSFQHDFTKKIIESNTFLCQKNTKNEPRLIKIFGDIDYVIGNPPYVTLYGRRDKKTSEQQRIDYLLNYKQFPRDLKNGKINFVMLFIEHGLDFLKENGILSFIIDISFFESAYIHTRKYLLENTKIKSVIFNIKAFDVGSGQLIITIEKNKSNKGNVVIITNDQTGEITETVQDKWYKRENEYRFKINDCKNSNKIIEKIRKKDNTNLKELYPNKNLRTCVMLLDKEEQFIGQETKKGVINYPFFEGSKGLKEAYGQLTHKNLFYFDKELQNSINEELKQELIKKGVKNKKRIGFGEAKIYDNPKIYIRQSAKTIIATYDESKSAANNSLYVFSLRDKSRESIRFLKFLCGFLNSEITTFYAQKENIIRYSKGKQPQIKISDLYNIRIPEDTDLQLKISELVDEIYINSDLKKNNQSKIDNLIYDYYSLDKTEVQFIKTNINNFLTN